MRQVLLDNFTLQGSFGYLHDRHTRLRGNCSQLLLEAVVLYDRIHVPRDVLERSEPSKWVADQFPEVIVGDSMPLTPDLHHHVIDMEVLSTYRGLLRRENPFARFETREAYDIEKEGYPQNWVGPNYMGKSWGGFTFSERHLYYSWFCARLAGELGLNYVPNPTRALLFQDEAFRAKADIPDLARDILAVMQKARADQASSIQEVFASVTVPVTLPLVYSYIKGRGKNAAGLVHEALALRDSAEARAYRKYCDNLEAAWQGGSLIPAAEAVSEIKALASQWSKSLGKSKGKRVWQVGTMVPGASVSTPIETRWPKFGALDRKPQFVFVHRLLSERGAAT